MQTVWSEKLIRNSKKMLLREPEIESCTFADNRFVFTSAKGMYQRDISDMADLWHLVPKAVLDEVVVIHGGALLLNSRKDRVKRDCESELPRLGLKSYSYDRICANFALITSISVGNGCIVK